MPLQVAGNGVASGGKMQKIDGLLHLSSGDLVGHLNCRHLTELDLRVANGELDKPKVWDPALEALAERGALHERGFIEHLKAGGLAVTAVDGVAVDQHAVAVTIDAMARGEAIIVQGALQAGRWSGRADVLRRVETPSRFGAWSYEVIDTKLARETKGNTVLQISLYSDLLSETQGAEPLCAFVVTPGADYTPQAYRIADYAAYYRHVRSTLSRAPSPAFLILSRSNIAVSAVGAVVATREEGPTIICLSSPVSANHR
jgi:predicted RecB family nuclease